MSGSAAAERLGCNRSTLSRLVSRMVDAGVVQQPAHGMLRLAPDWRDSVELATKLMPSYGMAAARHAAWLDARIARLTDYLRQAPQDADPAQLAMAQQALDLAHGMRAEVDQFALDELPDPQRRRVLRRGGTWDALLEAARAARRLRQHAYYDKTDATAEADRQRQLDDAAGITPELRRRADALYAEFGAGR